MILCTAHEATAILKVSRVTLKKWADTGRIRTVKMNTDLPRPTVLYLETDVRKLAIDREARGLYH